MTQVTVFSKYWDDQTRKDELGGAFSINERDRLIRTKFWLENVKVKATHFLRLYLSKKV